MKKWLLSLLILILLIPAMPVAAQDIGSPEDNACNPGGAMYRENPADGCNSEWHWVCGYYLARFYRLSYNMGGYDTSLVPDWCHSLLPPRPQVPANISVVETSSPGCYTNGVQSFRFVSPAPFDNAEFFNNTTCTGEGNIETIVFNEEEEGAETTCENIFEDIGIGAFGLNKAGYNIGVGYWLCIESL